MYPHVSVGYANDDGEAGQDEIGCKQCGLIGTVYNDGIAKPEIANEARGDHSEEYRGNKPPPYPPGPFLNL